MSAHPFRLVILASAIMIAIAITVPAMAFGPAAPGGGNSNTASFASTASARIEITEVRDAAGLTLTSLPAGVTFTPSQNSSPTTVEETGTGQLVFAGVFTATGSGLSSVVDLAANVSGTATPAGVANGIETAAGGIQIINQSAGAIEVKVRFDGAATATGSVTDTNFETVTNTGFDVEFSRSIGGIAGSPCTTMIIAEGELLNLAAPPDFTAPPYNQSVSQTVTVLPNQTCSFNVLVQVAGRAAALAPPTPTAVPPTPTSTSTPVPPTTAATSTPVPPTATSTAIAIIAATATPSATTTPLATPTPIVVIAPTATPTAAPTATPTPTAVPAPALAPVFTG